MAKCKITNKLKFNTEQQASNAILNAKIKRAFNEYTNRKEVRYYKCPNCKAYHLTSKQQWSSK